MLYPIDGVVSYARFVRQLPATRGHDYDSPRCGSGPVDWWLEGRWMLCKAMRLAYERGLPHVVRMLEPSRERAAAQTVAAEEDLDRRFGIPEWRRGQED